VHEDDDPATRMMVAINDDDDDIGDYMEWSGAGWWPVNVTNDADKLAIDYIVSEMTH